MSGAKAGQLLIVVSRTPEVALAAFRKKIGRGGPGAEGDDGEITALRC